MAKSNKDINFLHIDIDATLETLPNQVSNINSVPTFHFYKDGKVVDKLEGANLNTLKAKLDKLKEKKQETQKSASASAGASAEASAEETKEVVTVISTGSKYKEMISSGKCIVDFSGRFSA
jgi:thiol-disulfide isomerase/thioredoxin